MDYSEKILHSLLHEIINELQGSAFKDALLVIVGGAIGFMSTYLMYRISRKNIIISELNGLLSDIYRVAGGIKQNLFRMKVGLCINRYTYFTSMFNDGMIRDQEFVKYNTSISEDKYESYQQLTNEFLTLILKFRLDFGENEELNNAIRELQEYNVTKEYFKDIENQSALNEKFKALFPTGIEEEMKSEFEPLLNKVLMMLKIEIKDKKGKLKRFF